MSLSCRPRHVSPLCDLHWAPELLLMVLHSSHLGSEKLSTRDGGIPQPPKLPKVFEIVHLADLTMYATRRNDVHVHVVECRSSLTNLPTRHANQRARQKRAQSVRSRRNIAIACPVSAFTTPSMCSTLCVEDTDQQRGTTTLIVALVSVRAVGPTAK